MVVGGLWRWNALVQILVFLGRSLAFLCPSVIVCELEMTTASMSLMLLP